MQKNKLTKRKEQAIASKQKIFDTAIMLFDRKGFDKVTVDDICEKSGVSKGAFYHHFKSKEQVVIEAFLSADAIYEEYAFAELPRHKDFTKKMYLFLRKTAEFCNDVGIDNMQITFRSQINSNRRNAAIASEKRALYKITENLIEEGQSKGEICTDLSKEDIMRIVIRCIRGVIYDWCLMGGRFDLVKETEKTIAVLIKGLRPD
jgi:TetR/AcrR family transcriptional regulator, cholesterol catabolism regulator